MTYSRVGQLVPQFIPFHVLYFQPFLRYVSTTVVPAYLLRMACNIWCCLASYFYKKTCICFKCFIKLCNGLQCRSAPCTCIHNRLMQCWGVRVHPNVKCLNHGQRYKKWIRIRLLTLVYSVIGYRKKLKYSFCFCCFAVSLFC